MATGAGDWSEIEKVNTAFYEAFEALDIDAMDAVWAARDYAACVHPGQEVIVGWPEVRESLDAIFDGTGKIRFRLTNVKIEVRGAAAWAFVLENIHHGDDVLVAVQATNIFERTPEGWRMILHHASPISDDAGEPDTDFMQ
jgi:ketosteroid isomerase-like protein